MGVVVYLSAVFTDLQHRRWAGDHACIRQTENGEQAVNLPQNLRGGAGGQAVPHSAGQYGQLYSLAGKLATGAEKIPIQSQ